jgi:hypothetical protein
MLSARWCCHRRNMDSMPKTDSVTRREIQQMVRRIVSRFHAAMPPIKARGRMNLAHFFLRSPLRDSNLDLKRDRRPAGRDISF